MMKIRTDRSDIRKKSSPPGPMGALGEGPFSKSRRRSFYRNTIFATDRQKIDILYDIVYGRSLTYINKYLQQKYWRCHVLFHRIAISKEIVRYHQ